MWVCVRGEGGKKRRQIEGAPKTISNLKIRKRSCDGSPLGLYLAYYMALCIPLVSYQLF